MRRQVFDTKRRLTQKLKNAFENPDGSTLPGGLDDEYKNMKKLEIQELKQMLVRLAGAIKSHIASVSSISDSAGMISSCMMELSVEQRENQSKGYVHASLMQEAAATMELGGRTSLETLRDAHESLQRKIADFKTIEKQISEFEIALLDVQAYDRKMKDAEAVKDACVSSPKPGSVEAAQVKVDKVSFKLSQSQAGYNSLKESLWNAFEWYQRAGGLLAAQEAEALRAAQLSFFESSVAALRSVPSYGPAELTADLNACSADWSSTTTYNDFETVPIQNAEETFFKSSVSNQDSENDLFETGGGPPVELYQPEHERPVEIEAINNVYPVEPDASQSDDTPSPPPPPPPPPPPSAQLDSSS